MTKLEALKSTINFPLPELIFSKALIDAELDGTAEYTSLDTKADDLAALGLLFVLLTSADIKEGDYAISLDRGQLLRLYSYICSKHGVPNLLAAAKPTVKAVSVW